MYLHRLDPLQTTLTLGLSIFLGLQLTACEGQIGVPEEDADEPTFSAQAWVDTNLGGRRGPTVARTGTPQKSAAPDASWVTIASEYEPPNNAPGRFSLSGTQTIMYGAQGRGWVKMEVTGPGVCSNQFFKSDPAFMYPKVCKAKANAVRPTPSSGSRTPTPAATPTVTPPAAQPVPAGLGTSSPTMRVSGRTLLDTCGQPFVARGIENFLWAGTDFGPSLEGMIDEIAKTGANAVRLLPALDSFGGNAVSAVDRLIGAATRHGMVVYLSVGVDKRHWFSEPAVKQMLDKHKRWLIVDIFQEATYDDRARWKRETLQAIQEFRRDGYTVPVTMMANQGGRDLAVLLSDGDELVAADTARNTILGWQAYWGEKGFYMDHYGMSLEEAVDQISALDYPVQLGLLQWADGNDMLDYSALMRLAEQRRLGWLWWDFFLPPNTSNSLSTNGTASSLSAWGRAVIQNDQYSIARTARKACGR